MPQKDTVRKELLFAGILSGKTPAQAAREAGYSLSYSRVNVYKWLAKDSTRQRLQTAIKEVEIDGEEALRTLDFHCKGDIADVLPDNEILKAAKKNGVSKLIRKIRQKERFVPQGPGKECIREVVTEIEVYGAQGAAKHLSSLLMSSKEDPPPPTDFLFSDAERKQRLAELIAKVSQRAIDVEGRVIGEAMVPAVPNGIKEATN